MTTTTSTSTTPSGRRADQLLERARIALAKAGGHEQPSGASDVTDVDGVTIVTLRNVNGVLATYRLQGRVLKRVITGAATVDQLFNAAFSKPRDPRSAEYRAGVRAALAFRIEGAHVSHPYNPATAQDDAFHAGMAEGHAIWRAAQAEAATAAGAA